RDAALGAPRPEQGHRQALRHRVVPRELPHRRGRRGEALLHQHPQVGRARGRRLPGEPAVSVDRKQHLYLWLAGIFVTALLIGDLTGGRYFRVGSFDLSAGMLLFPITFVLTDVVNEFYGPVGAKRITFLGLGLAGLAFLFINVVLALPPSKIGLPSEAVTQVLGSSRRVYIGSLAAYLIGQLSDIAIFGVFRRLTGHRMIWLRATGSTLISQAIDTLVVNAIFLGGTQPIPTIARVMVTAYVLKIVFAVGLTPIIYAAHGLMFRVLKIRETPEKA